MNDISLDCLFAVNFCLNYLTLRLCTTILKPNEPRLSKITVVALAVAALECASCVFPKLLPTPVLAIFSFLLVLMTFWRTDLALLYSCVSLWTGVLMTFAMKFFKGVLPMDEVSARELQFNKNRLFLAVFTLAALIFLKFHFDKAQKRTSNATLEVVYKNKKAKLLALRDSGNLLKDPLSGRPVAILSQNGAKRLGVGNDPITDLITDANSRIRVIPVKSVGYTGILYAFVPKFATIDGKKQSICIAIDPQNEDFSGFDAIIPSNI